MITSTILIASAAVTAAANSGGAGLPEPASYTAIGWLVLSLAAIATAANQVDDFWARKKGKPPAGELHVAAAGLSQRVTKLEENYGTIASELASTRIELMADNDERRHSIEQKIDALRAETKADLREFGAKIDGLNAGNEQRVLEVHKRVNVILDVVAELRGRIVAKQR